MSKQVLYKTEPERVLFYFENIAMIPHGSRNTKAISDYCVEFAKSHGFEYYQDQYNNVIIIKEASKGRESEAPIIIQGHLDMVCEKAPDCTKDMAKEGLDLFVDGDMVGAYKTTLGGDDGIAVAMALAILEDEQLSHPRLEVVFTVDEEIGMLGASDIDVSPLKGHIMLNIDSEEEGVFTVSCAGGVVAECRVPFKEVPNTNRCYEIEIKGLIGGHSGIEINKGRATSNKLLAEILNGLYKKCRFNLISVKGGMKDNAIPTESKACISSGEKSDVIEKVVKDIANVIITRYKTVDPGIQVSVKEIDLVKTTMDRESTEREIKVLLNMPEGIQKMSEDVEGLVQTSLNMGILLTEAGYVSMSYCVRSSVDEEKHELLNRMKTIVEAENGKVILSGDYSGWKYRQESPLRDTMSEIYYDMYAETPRIEAVHAGVECGIFAGKIENLDCISYGPNLSEIHTYRERMSISSVKRVYDMTRKVIEKGVKE